MASTDTPALLCPYTSTTCPLLAPYASFENNGSSQTPPTPSACASAHSSQPPPPTNNNANDLVGMPTSDQQTSHHRRQQSQSQQSNQAFYSTYQPPRDANSTLYDGSYQSYSPNIPHLNPNPLSPYSVIKDRDDRSLMVPIHSLVSSQAASLPPQCRPSYPSTMPSPYQSSSERETYERSYSRNSSRTGEFSLPSDAYSDSRSEVSSAPTPSGGLYAPSPALLPMPPVPYLQRPNFHPGLSAANQSTPISLPSPSALFSNSSFIPEDRQSGSHSNRQGAPNTNGSSMSSYGNAAACDMEDMMFQKLDGEEIKSFEDLRNGSIQLGRMGHLNGMGYDQSVHQPNPTLPPPPPPAAEENSTDAAASGGTGEQTAFISKLWHLLSHPEYSRYLKWNQPGDAFILTNSNEFAINVLPRFFRHSNVASFVRQLNLYSFQRVSTIRLLDMADSSTSTSIVAHQTGSHHARHHSHLDHDPSKPIHHSADSDSDDHLSHSSGSPPPLASVPVGDSTIAASGFTHPHFKRDHPELLKLLKPRGSNKKTQSKKPAHTVGGTETKRPGAAKKAVPRKR